MVTQFLSRNGNLFFVLALCLVYAMPVMQLIQITKIRQQLILLTSSYEILYVFGYFDTLGTI